jgi:Double-GTPase 2
MASKLACPYCYETFTSREIMFRCNGRLSRTNKQCPLRLDSILERRIGVRREQGPVFSADGRKSNAECPDCGGETTYRICPVCHSQLPVQFGMVGSRMIAMAGAKASGKTVYMTVLLHELRNRVGDRFGAAIMGADDETRKQFVDRYENPIYAESKLPLPTQRAAQRDDERVPPLVFRFSAKTGGLRGGRPTHNLLSFFDTAGEDFREQESLDVNTRYLACSDGILLLLDPLQMPGARKLAVSGIPMPGTGPEYETPQNILSRVTDILLATNPNGARGKISKPIAVVFTKLDAVWHNLDRSSPLRAQPLDGPKFDVADCLDVHEEIRHLLRDWEGGQISQVLENNYARYRFFGTSALGQPPTETNAVAPSGIQPYRVADPLLWMLSEFGAVPKAGKG